MQRGQLVLQPLPLQHQEARVCCSLGRCSLLFWSHLKHVVLHSQRDRELCAAFAQDELWNSILMWKLKSHQKTFRGPLSSLIIGNPVPREFLDGSTRIHLCTVLGLRALPSNTGQPWAAGGCKKLQEAARV